MTADLTIIVPVLNREHLITRCLDSIKAQSFRPLHLVVVDNVSSDETMAVVTKWSRENADDLFRISILQETQPGAAAARNRGLQEAETDFVMFFDSDDTMRPDLAKNVIEHLYQNPSADIVYWKAAIHHSAKFARVPFFSSSNVLSNQLYHSLLSTQKYAVRRRLLVRAGQWAPSLTCWDDFELGVRLLLLDPITIPMNKVMVDIYPQAQSITGTDYSSSKGKWEKALDMIENDIKNSARKDVDALLRIVAYRRMHLAAQYYREGKRKHASLLLQKAINHPSLNGAHRRWMKLMYYLAKKNLRGIARLAAMVLR